MNRREFLNTGVSAVVAPMVAGRSWASRQTGTPAAALPAPGADGWISLINGRDLTGWYTYLETSGKDKDPRGCVKVEEGMSRSSCRGTARRTSSMDGSSLRSTTFSSRMRRIPASCSR